MATAPKVQFRYYKKWFTVVQFEFRDKTLYTKNDLSGNNLSTYITNDIFHDILYLFVYYRYCGKEFILLLALRYSLINKKFCITFFKKIIK